MLPHEEGLDTQTFVEDASPTLEQAIFETWPQGSVSEASTKKEKATTPLMVALTS